MLKMHYCIFLTHFSKETSFCHTRQGREVVCATALHILFDFCVAKMAESKDLESLDSARFALSHALFILFGKALHKVF